MDALTVKALNILGRLWQGPPLRVKRVGLEQSVKLGRGEANTTVTLPASMSLRQLVKETSLTFGEAYMRGEITIEGDIMDVLLGFHRNSNIWEKLERLVHTAPPTISGTTPAQARANAQRHYDIGNNFYRLWLDPSLTYSCAYFPDGNETLEQAQFKKRELVCQKLLLDEPNLTLLDIGCGWGALLFHAAERYGARVTGLTPAHEQAVYIRQEASRRGLEGRVKVVMADWREYQASPHDRIVSVGMFEHVGQPQYDKFFITWRALLKEGGLSLLHTIGHTQPTAPNPWIKKYIFPGGYLPTEDEIRTHAAGAGLTIPAQSGGLPGWQNLRPYYAKTLALWAENVAAQRKGITAMFDEEFYRMWELYLKAAEAGFRAGDLQLYQVVLR